MLPLRFLTILLALSFSTMACLGSDTSDGDGGGDGDGDTGGDGDGGDGDAGDGDGGDGDAGDGDAGDGDGGDGDSTTIGMDCRTTEDCDDGRFCNGVEICTLGTCRAGDVPGGDDGIACTVAVCDEGTDTIIHEPDPDFCDDGRFCNGTETCDARVGCRLGTPPAEDDGIPCTDARCDEDLDVIVHEPNDYSCNDGLWCNGVEVCDPVADCQPGTPPVVDDGMACTADSCNEALDRVEHTDACDDGLYCNGLEVCGLNGCVPGTAPTDDGIPCTTDVCNEVNDTVTHTPNNAMCPDDGLYCNGEEVCMVGVGCSSINAPGDDGVACTSDSCDELNDQVINTPNNGACNDLNSCTTDTCDAINGCEVEWICANQLLLDSTAPSTSSTTRNAEYACGTRLTVGASNIQVQELGANIDLNTAGQVKFFIFDHTAGDALVYESLPINFADDGTGSVEYWKLSGAMNHTLQAGRSYCIVGMANVGARYLYDTIEENTGYIQTHTNNPNVTGFTSPTQGGHAGADCGVQIWGAIE